MSKTMFCASFGSAKEAMQAIELLSKNRVEAMQDEFLPCAIVYYASDYEEKEVNKILTEAFCDEIEVKITAQDEIKIICNHVSRGSITLDEAYRSITNKSLDYFAGYSTLEIMKMLVKAGNKLYA